MRTTKQINSFWEIAREQTVEGEVLRRRITVIGAITVGFCGLLIAIGLGVVVLVFLAAVVVSVGVAALLTVWPRLRAFRGHAITYVRNCSRATRRKLVPVWGNLVSAASTLLAKVRTHSNALARAVATAASRVRRAAGQTAHAATTRFGPRVARVDATREAMRLNATGTQRRRDGHHDAAVECHRQALEILRRLGDLRGVALTQSNLALALSHAGDDTSAIGLFEEAAATLRELGDEDHEAKVIANLGVTHRRHGRRDEAENVLELALSKLSPASSAYQAIEAELRRAS
jgi:hypothetical protein